VLQRLPNNLNIKNVTIPGLRVLNIKKNTKTGTLNNSYVLVNKADRTA